MGADGSCVSDKATACLAARVRGTSFLLKGQLTLAKLTSRGRCFQFTTVNAGLNAVPSAVAKKHTEILGPAAA